MSNAFRFGDKRAGLDNDGEWWYRHHIVDTLDVSELDGDSRRLDIRLESDRLGGLTTDDSAFYRLLRNLPLAIDTSQYMI